jgi:NAD+ synthase (glutamine-hydrolysing)
VSGGLDSTLALIVCQEACDLLGLDHSAIVAISMPGFGTTTRTRTNAERLVEAMGAELRVISIDDAVRQHFKDIGHDEADHSTVFENAQARERTQILMDVANQVGGLVVGTGDLSELALGWTTYNADHMSMYGVNAGIPKTLVRHLIEFYSIERANEGIQALLQDILQTPISPELLPPDASGSIEQRTEDMIGPYEVHDFFLYHFVRMERPVRTITTLALIAFRDVYRSDQILEWFRIFLQRFFSQQYKRSCLPDGPKVGSVALSPRADWRMPSDAHPSVWLAELDELRRTVDS